MAEKEYIERGALIDKIFPIGLIDDGRYVIPAKAVKTAIDKAPTADVAPVVHGEWIFDFELDGSNFYECSVCGRQEVLLAKESTDEYFPYCHCGAKMDGERNGV